MRHLNPAAPNLETHHANVQLLPTAQAWQLLRTDLADAGPAYLYAYLVHPPWFDALFGDHLERDELTILADNHQRTVLTELLNRHKKLRVATWPANRTMHDKTIILPFRSLVYFTTANVTRGAWTLSLNQTIRLESHSLTRRLTQAFELNYQGARPLLRCEIP